LGLPGVDTPDEDDDSEVDEDEGAERSGICP
jgi:hypothetical protein